MRGRTLHRSAFAWLALLCALGSLLLPASNSYAQVSPPYNENFDSEPTCGTGCGNACVLSTSGWVNDTVNDNYDWTVDAGGTGSGLTGPPGDHTTGSGNYLYTTDENQIETLRHGGESTGREPVWPRPRCAWAGRSRATGPRRSRAIRR